MLISSKLEPLASEEDSVMIKYSSRLSIVPFLFILNLLVSSCAHLDSKTLSKIVKEPSLEVENIAVTGLDLNSVELTLNLNVSNPNSYGINLSGYSYNIQLNNKELFSSTDNEGFSVPALADKSIKVPLTIGFNDAMALVKEVKPGAPLKYTVDADLLLDVVVMKNFKVSTTKEGELNIPQIPTIAFKNMKASNFSFTGAKLTLMFDVNNPNSFPIRLKDLQYNVGASGNQWGAGSVSEPVTLEKRQKTTLNIPFNINFAQAGSGVLSLLRGGNFKGIDVDGEFTVDSDFPGLNDITIPLNFSPGM